MKGLVLNHMGRRDEGIDLVKKGIKLDLTSHICWHVFGLIQKSDKNYEEALKSYTQALRFDKARIKYKFCTHSDPLTGEYEPPPRFRTATNPTPTLRKPRRYAPHHLEAAPRPAAELGRSGSSTPSQREHSRSQKDSRSLSLLSQGSPTSFFCRSRLRCSRTYRTRISSILKPSFTTSAY